MEQTQVEGDIKSNIFDILTIKDRFLRMLQRYIYSKIPRKIARVKLAQTLEMVTCLREMADIKKMRKINVNVKVP